MATAQQTSNKATITCLQDANNSCDLQRISQTIDEVFAPDALVSTPLPIEATGAQVVKEVFARLVQGLPDLHITIEDLIADEDRWSVPTRLPGLT